MDQVENLGVVTWFRSYNWPNPYAEVYAPNIVVHIALKVLDMCLWYLDRGWSRYMTGDKSLFKTLEQIFKEHQTIIYNKILEL